MFIEGIGVFTSPTQTLPPFSRTTFNMKDVLGALQQQTGLPVKFSSFSTRVQTVNPADKIVVEHSRYWNSSEAVSIGSVAARRWGFRTSVN